MSKNTPFLLLTFLNIILLSSSIFAQSLCTPQRYVNEIFTEQVTSNAAIFATVDAVIYPPYINEATTYSRDLYFDLYEPQGDVLTKRPLIIMAFGGAFLAGGKDFQQQLIDYCSLMARKGYVVASIDYRLGFNVLNGDTAIRAVYKGAQDFKAAIRYFKENAALYGIDPDLIIGGGNSAGAINAMHAAYLDDVDRTMTSILEPTFFQDNIFVDWPDLGCLDCSGNTFNHPSKPMAIVNLWGAVGDVAWIQNTEAPLISFHGLDDTVVSPNTASPFGVSAIFPAMSGSVVIHDYATNTIGLESELHTYPGVGHEVWDDNTRKQEIFDLSSDFLFRQLQPDSSIVNGTLFACEGETINYNINNTRTNSTYCWDVTGGTIVANNNNNIEVLWGSSGTGTIQVNETTCNGAVGQVTTITVTINPSPISNFIFSYNDNIVDFVNTSTLGNTYLWDFGDGNTSTLLNPSHLYIQNGTYTVTLTTTSIDGCMDTFSMPVMQNCQPNMVVMNNPTTSAVYQVEDWIQSSLPIQNGANVSFKAETCVELLSGFEVPLGAEFLGITAPCNN